MTLLALVGISAMVLIVLGVFAIVRMGALAEAGAISAENDRRILRARAQWGDEEPFFCRIDETGLIRMITPDVDEDRQIVFGRLDSDVEVIV